MDAPPPSPAPPSAEHLADLVRRGEAIRREAERLVTDAFRAIAGDPTLGPAAARDVAEYLARQAGATGDWRPEQAP
jgi:hypothetical protein